MNSKWMVWSAVTMTVAGSTIIIANCSHSPERENSNSAHVISHIVLRHEPSQVFVTADGSMMMREYNQTFEAEAECLNAVLLVPRAALLQMLKEGLSDAALAKYFGVSLELPRMRLHRTGVLRQLGRRAAPAA
jgi:Zn-dependent peptidase ImmA (M78 family)